MGEPAFTLFPVSRLDAPDSVMRVTRNSDATLVTFGLSCRLPTMLFRRAPRLSRRSAAARKWKATCLHAIAVPAGNARTRTAGAGAARAGKLRHGSGSARGDAQRAGDL